MSALAGHDLHTQRLLAHIEAGQAVTQRSLARELGIALGLTNLLVRRVVTKGWVKVVNIKPNRVRYMITPSGIAQRARLTRAYLENTLHLYTETRERIRASLQRVSLEWPVEDGRAAEQKRIVFYGAGEVAEIAYVGLQGIDLRLVGVVDDYVRRPFFGMPVHPPESLAGASLDGEAFGRLVIMSIRKTDIMRAKLDDLGFPSDRVAIL